MSDSVDDLDALFEEMANQRAVAPASPPTTAAPRRRSTNAARRRWGWRRLRESRTLQQAEDCEPWLIPPFGGIPCPRELHNRWIGTGARDLGVVPHHRRDPRRSDRRYRTVDSRIGSIAGGLRPWALAKVERDRCD